MATKIEWTEETWNPATGCTKVSAGCKYCYAERMAKRLKASPNPKIAHKYRNGFQTTIHPYELLTPTSWKKPRKVFVCSMGDLFHKNVPSEIVKEVFYTMQTAWRHTYQVLTKRPERLLHFDKLIEKQIWCGVTVENEDTIGRIGVLKRSSAGVRFVSFEPLLGPIPDLNLEGIHWVIVGGENNGSRDRAMNPDWAYAIRDMCIKQKVPFFFKGYGNSNKYVAVKHREMPDPDIPMIEQRLSDWKEWNEFPNHGGAE